jgi:adenine/guanine phosphoribosyltransferase-like PRPP-binding protein
MKSMRVMKPLGAPERITIVDDVVTKGATLLAAASLLADVFPDAEILAFALVRTTGLIPNVERIVDPVVGTIRRTPYGGTDRDP